MYLIRAEQRFGNGDHLFTIDEQSNAINALYDVARGEHQQSASAGGRGSASRSTSDRYSPCSGDVRAVGARGWRRVAGTTVDFFS